MVLDISTTIIDVCDLSVWVSSFAISAVCTQCSPKASVIFNILTRFLIVLYDNTDEYVPCDYCTCIAVELHSASTQV